MYKSVQTLCDNVGDSESLNIDVLSFIYHLRNWRSKTWSRQLERNLNQLESKCLLGIKFSSLTSDTNNNDDDVTDNTFSFKNNNNNNNKLTFYVASDHNIMMEIMTAILPIFFLRDRSKNQLKRLRTQNRACVPIECMDHYFTIIQHILEKYTITSGYSVRTGLDADDTHIRWVVDSDSQSLIRWFWHKLGCFNISIVNDTSRDYCTRDTNDHREIWCALHNAVNSKHVHLKNIESLLYSMDDVKHNIEKQGALVAIDGNENKHDDVTNDPLNSLVSIQSLFERIESLNEEYEEIITRMQHILAECKVFI